MASHQISVTVDAGSIAVDPDTLVMSSKDDVRWTGRNARRFSIVFDGAGPFDRSNLAHPQATTAQQPRTKGRFKYSIVSDENPGLTLDPVVIVEDPPTNPHGA